MSKYYDFEEFEKLRASEWANFFDHISAMLHYNAPPSKEDIEACKRKCERRGFPEELLKFPNPESGLYED